MKGAINKPMKLKKNASDNSNRKRTLSGLTE